MVSPNFGVFWFSSKNIWLSDEKRKKLREKQKQKYKKTNVGGDHWPGELEPRVGGLLGGLWKPCTDATNEPQERMQTVSPERPQRDATKEPPGGPNGMQPMSPRRPQRDATNEHEEVLGT